MMRCQQGDLTGIMRFGELKPLFDPLVVIMDYHSMSQPNPTMPAGVYPCTVTCTPSILT